MKQYNDYKKDKSAEDLTEEDFKSVEWTRYKIVVPKESDKKELMEAFRHIHDSDVNTDFIVINQLSHEYLDEETMDEAKNNIIVNDDIFNAISSNEKTNVIWSEERPPIENVSFYDHVVSKTPIGNMVIDWKSWKDRPDYDIHFNDQWIGCADSLEDAKKEGEEYLLSKLGELSAFLNR